MPFLLLDDATQEAQRRLQDYGDGLMQQAQQLNQQAPFAPGGGGTQALQDVTQRLQDFGSQQLQALNPPQQQPQQPQMTTLDQGGGLQDITRRLQDFGSQQLQNLQGAQQNVVQQLEPLNQPPFQQQQPAPQQLQDQVQPGGDLQAYARQAAQKAGIDPDIFTAQIQQESGFNPSAKSPAGAIGIAQFMPGTAQGMGIDPTDPYAALDAAAKMDAQHLAQYGGDWSKTLAAYNAGPGAVAQYDGVPPYAETQRYVQNILGNAKQGAQNVVQTVQQGAQQAVQGAQQAASNALPAISQFGDKQLTAAEAYAACGPAAAVRFATMMGRQPTLREATDLAAQVGWTPQGGMAGLNSESQLFDKMQIPHRMVGADWQALAKEAGSGNPVTISTTGHYFTADGYDPNTGAFHVGSSGTDLKGGGEWMTPDQMEARMGKLQGGMAVDNPQVPAASPLADPQRAVQQVAGQAAGQVVDTLGQAGRSAWTLLNQGADLAGQAPLPFGAGRVSDLASVARGGQAAADVIEQQRQQYVNRPSEFQQFMDNVDAARNQDWGRFVQGTFDLAQRAVEPMAGGPQADISQAVSAGLTAGGMDPDSARVLGQVANVVGPVALERAIPEVVGAAQRGVPQVAGAALSRALGAYDVLRPPEEAFASTFASQPGGAQRMSVPDLVTAIQQYPEEVQQGLRDFVQAQTQAGVAGSDINDTLRQWVADNPLRTPSTAPTLEPEVAASLRPGSGPLAAPLPEQSATDVVTGLQNMARERPPLEPAATPQPPGTTSGFTAPTSTPPMAEATLPTALAKSDPRYNYGAKGFQLQFNSDTEKALYIVAQKTPSKADAQFMDFLRDQFPGESDATIRQMGADVRSRIKTVAATADPADGRLQVPPERPTTPSPATTPEAVTAQAGPGPTAAPETTSPTGPPLETLTSGRAPVPPAPAAAAQALEGARATPGTPVTVETPNARVTATVAPTRPGLVGRILGAPGAAASRFGSLVASALGPVENLPTDTAGVLRNYANMVGRQSDAAQVMAENQMRSAGARLDIPAVADQVQQVRGELRDQAARTLVDNLQAQGKAAPIANAPREFRTVTDNPNTYLANYAFSPDVVAPIKAVTDMSDIAANPLGSAVLKTIGTAKGTLFSLSNFHTLTEALNAAFTSPQTLANYARAFASDTFAQGLRSSMADTFDAAARAGVTGLAQNARPEDVGSQIGNAVWRRVVAGGVSGAGGAAAGYTETKLTGGTEEEARANAAKGGLAGLALAGVPLGSRGTVPEMLQSALWDRAVPLAKATAWEALTKGGMDANQAATVVNERFGGLNYSAMGRNPTLLDAQRLTLMASDWNEATVRQLGSAIFGGDGRGVRAGFLAKTIGGMMVATEAANYAFSGHSTLENQPGHQFEVELQNPNGGYLHFGILPGNVQAYLNLANTEVTDPSKRATAPTNFIVNRLSAPVGAGLDVALSAAGRPPFQVAKAGPVALGENVAPIGVSQVLQSTLQGGLNPAVAAGLAAAGLNPRYSSARGAGGGFAAPQTTRAPLPSRTAGGAQSGERAPVPKR